MAKISHRSQSRLVPVLRRRPRPLSAGPANQDPEAKRSLLALNLQTASKAAAADAAAFRCCGKYKAFSGLVAGFVKNITAGLLPMNKMLT